MIPRQASVEAVENDSLNNPEIYLCSNGTRTSMTCENRRATGRPESIASLVFLSLRQPGEQSSRFDGQKQRFADSRSGTSVPEKVRSSGVGSGVGWIFICLRPALLWCAVKSLGRPINTGDFRGAAFGCAVLPSCQI
jgi:hypothetical protein